MQPHGFYELSRCVNPGTHSASVVPRGIVATDDFHRGKMECSRTHSSYCSFPLNAFAGDRSIVGMTYFKRFRMEFHLTHWEPPTHSIPNGYELVPYSDDLLREHAKAKHDSFREELDADVFPCLSRHDGCLRLMNEITGRANFVPQATWLIRYHEPGIRPTPVGTVQGLNQDDWGAIQNLGIVPEHRGRGLGSILLMRSALGFQRIGLQRMHLEVTTENTGAVRLYERLGFRRAQVVYKAAEVAGV